MSVLKQELTYLINNIPDEKLTAIKPLLSMIYEDAIVIEPIMFDDLEKDEKEAVLVGMKEHEQGETFADEDIDWNNIDKLELD